MSGTELPLENYIQITLTDDRLQAYLHLTSWDDAFLCSRVQLEELLEKKGVVYGLQQDTLAAIAAAPQAFVNQKMVVACGVPPKNGKNGRIDYKYDLDNDHHKPMELEDGTVDYKELTKIYNIQKGELLAQRFLPEEGTAGITVTGDSISPKKGREVRFKVGKNVVTDAEQMRLYAAIDGVLTRTDRDKINVFPIYEVNGDLDYNIGNIDFIGSVVIRGNVLSGFRVKASGDIRITGSVEAAELTAGGSIEIGAGFLGQNKGVITAGKNVRSSFIQDGRVEAVEDIVVNQSIMHSTVRAGRHVICTGAKGLIVGGLIQAGEKVEARTVGNSMSTSTVIEVGVLPELRNELIELRSQARTVSENLKKAEQALVLLDQLAASGQLTPDKLALRIRLTNTRRQNTGELTEIRERIYELESSLEDADKAGIEIGSTIYSGTKLVIGRSTRFIKDTVMRVHFRLEEGDIVMGSRTG
ncbi:FapA family protein [Paenibacillus aurantius]|uniref:FapA family protein n=1 Tax=Paenibacillus aurantius TaxID=2918900 RepID=A0AA96LIS2_9BACL|nr:FapA family protein [Paenibacillus aurantius]WNQ13758.1 FapA family protein [Paenibacillus aurantius]